MGDDPSVTYCKRWNGLRHQPIDVISVSAARGRDSRGAEYTAVLSDHARTHTLIAVNWSLDYLATWFLDEEQRQYLKYGFRRVDPEILFLEQITYWEYPGDATRDFSSATKITSLFYQRDGIVKERVADTSAGTETTTMRSDVPVDINWEKVPAFGDWSRVAVWDRSAP